MKVNYTPENTLDILYIRSDYTQSIADLTARALKYFGEDTSLEKLDISSEKIHTRCLTYDLYDGSDYDDYIIIRRMT